MHVASCTWISSRVSSSTMHLTDTVGRKSNGGNIPVVERNVIPEIMFAFTGILVRFEKKDVSYHHMSQRGNRDSISRASFLSSSHRVSWLKVPAEENCRQRRVSSFPASYPIGFFFSVLSDSRRKRESKRQRKREKEMFCCFYYSSFTPQ